jgi:Tfp pilus assembly protein PilF
MSPGMNRTWILAALVPLFICAGLSAGQDATLPGQEQLAKGIAALRAGDLDSAERIFTLALHQGVRSPLVYHNLGVIAQERGQDEHAVARFRETLQLQPEFGPAHLLLGVSWLALGKNAEAARELRIAEKLMPAEPQVHLQLARAYDALEEHFCCDRSVSATHQAGARRCRICVFVGQKLGKAFSVIVEGDRQARFQLRASAPGALPGTLEPGEVRSGIDVFSKGG